MIHCFRHNEMSFIENYCRMQSNITLVEDLQFCEVVRPILLTKINGTPRDPRTKF